MGTIGVKPDHSRQSRGKKVVASPGCRRFKLMCPFRLVNLLLVETIEWTDTTPWSLGAILMPWAET